MLLLTSESSALVSDISPLDTCDIGSESWIKQCNILTQINTQAHLSAKDHHDEFVVEELLSQDKLNILIHNLIVLESWLQKSEQLISKMNDPFQSKLYFVFYHHAISANLLEICLYHQESLSEINNDLLLELIDWCTRKIILSQSLKKGGAPQDLKAKANALNFSICSSAITIIRYISQNISSLNLSVVDRIYNFHDIPTLLVPLIKQNPWKYQKNGKSMAFINQQWTEIKKREKERLIAVETQIWLSLCFLICNPVANQNYQIDDVRKNALLPIRDYMSESLKTQLSCLTNLHEYMERLYIIQVPSERVLNLCLVEQVLLLSEALENTNWEEVVEMAADKYFSPENNNLQEQLKRFASSFAIDTICDINEIPICVVCGEMADKRCSVCQRVWYCGRKCQVKDWKTHKQRCSQEN